MITNLVLLAGFWAAVGNFFKWLLVGVGGIALFFCLWMLAFFIIDEKSRDENEGIGVFIIAGIIGLIPTTFWLFIPYWEVCQWILFSIILFYTIIVNIRKVSIARTILLAISIAWGIFLFIKYLVIPYSTFFISLAKIIGVLAIVVLLVVVTKVIIKKINKVIYLKQIKKLQSIIEGMPIPNNAVFDSETKKLAKEAIKEISFLNNKIETASDYETKIKYKKELYDRKIYLFYQLSLKAESNNDNEAYSQFEKQLKYAKSSRDLRIDPEENKILQQVNTLSQELLWDWKSKIEKAQNKNYEKRITNIKNRNVKNSVLGFEYTSTNKLKDQTIAYADLANSIVNEINELTDYQNVLNKELTKIRLTAYRNIYLAVELLNYSRDNAGGKNLNVEKDSINVDVSPVERIDVSTSKISVNYDDICNNAVKGFENTVSVLRNIGYNPGKKAAFGIAAASLAFSAIENRLKQIEQNKNEQYRIIEEIKTIIPQLQKGRSELLRTIEIMEAIVKSNNGFYFIYAPLRDKVFNNCEEITYEDAMALTDATKEFNKISTAKL